PCRDLPAPGLHFRQSHSLERQMNTKALLTAALLAGIALPNAAFAQAYDADATIRIGSLYEPQNLDNTAGAGQGINEAFNGNVYEALFQLTDGGAVEPKLVDSFEASEDGLTYTFKLKEGVTF